MEAYDPKLAQIDLHLFARFGAGADRQPDFGLEPRSVTAARSSVATTRVRPLRSTR